MTNRSLAVADTLSSLWDPFDFVWGSSFPKSYEFIEPFECEYEGEDLVISCDLPGVKLEDVNVEVQGNYLRMSAVRRRKQDMKYSRCSQLPRDYDAETGEATLVDGVLSIRFKKLASAKSKKINIKATR